MPLISENIALLIFGVILILSVLVALFMGSYDNYDKGRFHIFIAVLAGLGVFVTFMFYYNLVLIQNQQQQLGVLQEISRINSQLVNSVLNEINRASETIPNFVLSITPLSNIACCEPECLNNKECLRNLKCLNDRTKPDPINTTTCTEKMVLSYKIFALWQDVVTSGNYIHLDASSYIANFLQRANSKQLYQQWIAARLDFDHLTQRFGDLLFKYGLPITIQTPQEYERVTQEFMNDEEYDILV